jgi:hypothetical protein
MTAPRKGQVFLTGAVAAKQSCSPVFSISSRCSLSPRPAGRQRAKSKATRRAASTLVAVAALFGPMSCSAGEPPPGESQPASVTPPAAPPARTSPSIHAITPFSNRLPTDSSPGTGETVPWTLVRIDNETNRIYLSTGQVSCTVPSVVHLQETPTEIVITVTGAPSSASFDSPCTAQKVSLVGYVQLSGPVGDRRLVGDTA